MKQQGLAEPLKGELDEQSTLWSELTKKEKFIEELIKENEVVIYNYVYVSMYVCMFTYLCIFVCMYICSYACAYSLLYCKNKTVKVRIPN